MGRRFFLALTLLSLASAGRGAAAGRVLGAEPAPLDATAVAIDVVVADARGRSVATLRPADFEVLVGGEPRTPTAVTFVAIDPRQPLGPEPLPPIGSRADEEREAAREGTRLFAIFLDEYHVSPAAAGGLREATAAFVRQTLGPRDLVVVVKPLDSLVSLRLTRDHDAVLQEIGTFEGRRGEFAPRDAFERSIFAGDPERIAAARAQVAASAITALARHLGPLGPSRKTMLVVSEGFSAPSRRRRDGALPTIDSAIAAANRANLAVYPVVPSIESPAVPARSPQESTAETERQSLERLARETNGAIVAIRDGSGAGFEQVARESAGFYVVTLDGGTDGRFHPVDVRVKRPGLQVRGRSGFWAASAEELARIEAASRPPAPPRLPRRTSPLIRAWFGQAPAAGGDTRVSFVWEPAAAVRASGSRTPPPARVLFKATDAEGVTVYEAQVQPSVPALAAGEGPRRITFAAPPGRLRIEMLIQDAQGRQVDTDVRDLAVTPFAAAIGLGTAEILRARTAREFRDLAANPIAAPVASREFSRTERLLVRVPVAAAAGITPTVTAHLVSRAGSRLRELTLTPARDGVHEIDLPLSWLAPGEYGIELVAGDGATPIAKEVIAFRIRP